MFYNSSEVVICSILSVAYFAILVGSLSELWFSYNLYTDGKLGIRFRATFFFLSTLLSLIRITQFMVEMFIAETSTGWFSIGFGLDVLGNIAFASCFLTVLLIFTSILELQHHKTVASIRAVSVTLFIILILIMVSLMITFEALYSTEISKYVTQGVGVDYELLAKNSVLWSLYQATMGSHAIFVFLFSTIFLSIGLLLHHSLVSGEKIHSVHTGFWNFSLTKKVLFLTITVFVSLLIKLIYLIPATFGVVYCASGCYFSLSYLLGEFIPLGSFLIILILSRLQIASSSKEHSNAIHLPNRLAASSTPKELDASKWISDIGKPIASFSTPDSQVETQFTLQTSELISEAN